MSGDEEDSSKLLDTNDGDDTQCNSTPSFMLVNGVGSSEVNIDSSSDIIEADSLITDSSLAVTNWK